MSNIDYLDGILEKYGKQVFSIRNAPKDAIYIGRGNNSIFGNPFPMHGEETREQVCIDFRKWLVEKIKNDKAFANKVKNLKGHNVKCFCSNETNSKKSGARWCHGHILLACADYLNKQ